MKKGIPVIWALAALFALLSAQGRLPTAYIVRTPASLYVCDALPMLTALGGAFALLRYSGWPAGLRLALAAAAIFPALIVYYGAGFDTPAVHSLAIGLAASLLALLLEGRQGREGGKRR